MGLKLKSTGGTGSVELNCPDNHNINTSFTLPTSNFTGGEWVLADGNGNVNIDSGTLYVDAVNDRVGIGTTSPDGQLHVAGAGNAITRIQSTDDNQAIINFSGSSGSALGQILYNVPSDYMRFYVNSAERMRIDSSGNLGIATNAPGTRLDVISTASASTAISRFKSGTTSGDRGVEIASDANSNVFIQTIRGSDNASNYQLCLNPNGGNVGIGTTSPVRKLVLSDATAAPFLSILNPSGQDGGILFGTSSNDAIGQLRYQTSNNKMVFKANGAERMSINTNGILSVPGIYNYTTATSANVAVLSAGQLYRSTSSSKYKTQVETLQDSYADALLQCRPVWYRSTCEGDNPAHGWWGFIAEEVAEIDPRLVHWKNTEVTYDEEGSAVETPCDPEPEGVAYDRFVPHLLNLIKRQQQAIETLETQNASFEARLAALEGGTTP